MADRYISRDMAIARLTKVEVTNRLATMTDAKREIAEMPAADVAPVVHGHWISLTDCSNAGVYCSICHKKVYKEDYAWCNRKNKLRSPYCPNCGAKMDGGADGETD